MIRSLILINALAVLSLSSVIGHATTPPPFAGACLAIDRLLRTSQGTRAADAVGLLEDIAMGRMEKLTAGSNRLASLEAEGLRQPQFKAHELRACAFRTLGRSEDPTVLEFLSGLNVEDIGADPSQQIWPAARVALNEARLLRMSDPLLANQFLESVLSARHDPISHFAVTLWATERLCNSGVLASMSVIQSSIREGYSGERAEQEVEFCEKRIHVILADSDRAKALGAALRFDDRRVIDVRLMRWAIDQLVAIHSPGADAELERFTKEVARVPQGSAAWESLHTLRPEFIGLSRTRQQ